MVLLLVEFFRDVARLEFVHRTGSDCAVECVGPAETCELLAEVLLIQIFSSPHAVTAWFVRATLSAASLGFGILIESLFTLHSLASKYFS